MPLRMEGILIQYPSGRTETTNTSTGELSTSYRTSTKAFESTRHILSLGLNVVLFNDALSFMEALSSSKLHHLATLELSRCNGFPGHCGLPMKENADQISGKGTTANKCYNHKGTDEMKTRGDGGLPQS